MKIKTLERKRYSIITDDLDHCYLCGMNKQHLHEVIFGKNRVNSMKYGLVIPVCMKCHNEIHNNNELDKKLKRIAQQKFEENYDIEFIKIFYKNYK